MSVRAASNDRPRGIRVLPANVAARIAAGEVIERPVSVVRELLDNAIDAGATRITVEIEEGGVQLIRVTDDGRGIPPDQLELAFERHATSKIGALEDLGQVATLGFRGEALPSIAAAADVDILSRAKGEPVGVQALLVESRVVRRTARPAPVGTSFTLRELFGRLPARRKFLGPAGSEGRHISQLVAHYALAYPGIAVTFSNNGRRALATSGDGDLRHAFAAVYGAGAGEEMLDVDLAEDDVHIGGLAGPPAVNRGNRGAISVFVNGRWVQSRPLIFAVTEAYLSQLPVGRFPFAAINIDIPRDQVDVNVHPAKAEVRFRDERSVARTVRHAVRAALERSQVVIWEAVAGGGISFGGSVPENGAHPEPGSTHPESEGARLPVTLLRSPEPLQSRLELPQAANSRPGTTRQVLPMLRVVGQMGATYIIAEGPDGMYLVDQHAAHERVMYDRIVARRAAGEEAPVQPLLEPALLELGLERAACLEEYRAMLESLGLSTEPFGDTNYLVRAVPAGIAGADIGRTIVALLDKLQGERRVQDPFARAAATVACHSSVRAGMALSLEEMRRLIEDLEATPTPRTCPHGRPTLVHLGTEAIERQFGRR